MKIFYLLLLRIHHGFDVGIDLREAVFAELDELLGFLQLLRHLVDVELVVLHFFYYFLEAIDGLFVFHLLHGLLGFYGSYGNYGNLWEFMGIMGLDAILSPLS